MTPYLNEPAHTREERTSSMDARLASMAKGFGPVKPNPASWRDFSWKLNTWIQQCEYGAELFAGSELGDVYRVLLAELERYTHAAKDGQHDV